jgi:hypothetical protein
MDDYFTTEQLKARCWTSRMIKAHLGKPDATQADPRGRLRKPIQLYARDRVLPIEETAARDDLGKLNEARDLARRAVAARKSREAGG